MPASAPSTHSLSHHGIIYGAGKITSLFFAVNLVLTLFRDGRRGSGQSPVVRVLTRSKGDSLLTAIGEYRISGDAGRAIVVFETDRGAVSSHSRRTTEKFLFTIQPVACYRPRLNVVKGS